MLNRRILKESSVVVLTGLLINYPLSLFFLYLLIDVLGITSVFWIGTLSTLGLTVVAFGRVYIIRRHYELSK
tara:strand:+ start:1078 stop:1293 length:216 start_codon:yes stop_codon:yes gene_type:complete